MTQKLRANDGSIGAVTNKKTQLLEWHHFPNYPWESAKLDVVLLKQSQTEEQEERAERLTQFATMTPLEVQQFVDDLQAKHEKQLQELKDEQERLQSQVNDLQLQQKKTQAQLERLQAQLKSEKAQCRSHKSKVQRLESRSARNNNIRLLGDEMTNEISELRVQFLLIGSVYIQTAC